MFHNVGEQGKGTPCLTGIVSVFMLHFFGIPLVDKSTFDIVTYIREAICINHTVLSLSPVQHGALDWGLKISCY